MIIDFHTHIFPPDFIRVRESFFASEPGFKALYQNPTAKLADCDALLRAMDQGHIDQAVVFGFPWEEAEHFRRHNDYIAESAAQYPDRLIGFGTFSPLTPPAQAEAERCLRNGLRGVGEIAVYHTGLGEEMIARLGGVMETLRRYQAPLLWHVNEPVGHDYAGKNQQGLGWIYRFLKRYPDNRIILAHWGGGLLFYNLLKKEAPEVLRSVWFDTAASPYLYRPEIYRIAGELIGFDKILFGSDFPLLNPERYFREMDTASLPAEAVRQITGLNALQLFQSA